MGHNDMKYEGERGRRTKHGLRGSEILSFLMWCGEMTEPSWQQVCIIIQILIYIPVLGEILPKIMIIQN